MNISAGSVRKKLVQARSNSSEQFKSKVGQEFLITPDQVRLVNVVESKNNSLRQAEIIEAALKAGKRHFGVSGASLTWLSSPELRKNLPDGWNPAVVPDALKAEQHTTRILSEWAADKPNVVLLDSLHIPGKGMEQTVDEETGLVDGGDTDHIMVCGRHVLIIDTKNWKVKASYLVKDSQNIIRNNRAFSGGRVHMTQACHMWFDYVDSNDMLLNGVIMIDNGDKPDPKTGDWQTSVFRNAQWWKNLWFLLEPSRIIEWFDEQYEKWNTSKTGETDTSLTDFIDVGLVTQLAVTCVKPYSLRDSVLHGRKI